MEKADNIKKQTLFNELHRCLDALRSYADLNSLLMPLLYVLCAHHKGHHVSLVGDYPNIFTGDKQIQPLQYADMTDAESDLLRRIRLSVDERYFHGKTVQIIYSFYSRCNPLINEFYPELIEFLFSIYSKNLGKSSGMFATPYEVTQLMYHLALQNDVRRVYDPCAGLCSGVLLPEFSGHDFIGQEIVEQIKLFAEIRMDAHDKQYPVYCEDVVEHWRGDGADCLCSDLPIGVKLLHMQSDAFMDYGRPRMLDDYIIWQFMSTASLRRAVLLVAAGACTRMQNFTMRKTLCDRNYVDMVIEMPHGVLNYTGADTAIIVLDKNRTSKNISFISATDCIKTISPRERIVDTDKVLARINGEDKTRQETCSVAKTYENDCSIDPVHYIKEDIDLLPGQKLVRITDIASVVRGTTRFDETEGRVLNTSMMSSSLVDFHTTNHELIVKSFEENDRFAKLTNSCVIFSRSYDSFFIKYDETPIFVRYGMFNAFEVDTTKCSYEYFTHIVMSTLASRNELFREARSRIPVRSLRLPFFEDLDSQRNIIERLYREAERELKAKIDKLQILSGESSDLLHNLGVTFTRLSAAVANIKSHIGEDREMSLDLKINSDKEHHFNFNRAISILDNNIEFALRQINSTGTDFTKAVPTTKKVVLQDLIEDYISAWNGFGYASFSLLPLKSSIPQTKVEVDKDLLFTALDCIFINAHQHGFNKRGGDNNHVLVELKAVTIKDNKYALISISNNGEPLPDGFTLKDFVARGVVGINSSQDGLGGHHVASIVHLHEGFVSIESSSDWLSFNMLIPTYINAKDTVFDEYECEYI